MISRQGEVNTLRYTYACSTRELSLKEWFWALQSYRFWSINLCYLYKGKQAFQSIVKKSLAIVIIAEGTASNNWQWPIL